MSPFNPPTRVDDMELLAAAGLFIGLALLAAIPLVLLLHFTGRHQDGKG